MLPALVFAFGVQLAQEQPIDLKILAIEGPATLVAGETMRVEPASRCDLGVGTLNAAVAALTQRVIEHVVVLCAVRFVYHHVEVHRREG